MMIAETETMPTILTVTESFESSRQAAALAEYVRTRPNTCLGYAEIWQRVLGKEFNYNPLLDNNNIQFIIYLAREKLREENPESDWWLLNVYNYPFIIFGQGHPGQEIELPGLYNFSGIPEEIKFKLAKIMEKGKLGKKKSGEAPIIYPDFTHHEAALLLKLAKSSRAIIPYEWLLWGPDRSQKARNRLRETIWRVRKKLGESATEIRIKTFPFKGYGLVLESP